MLMAEKVCCDQSKYIYIFMTNMEYDLQCTNKPKVRLLSYPLQGGRERHPCLRFNDSIIDSNEEIIPVFVLFFILFFLIILYGKLEILSTEI